MPSKYAMHSNQTAWHPSVLRLFFMLACACIPSEARGQEKPGQPLKQDEA